MHVEIRSEEIFRNSVQIFLSTAVFTWNGWITRISCATSVAFPRNISSTVRYSSLPFDRKQKPSNMWFGHGKQCKKSYLFPFVSLFEARRPFSKVTGPLLPAGSLSWVRRLKVILLLDFLPIFQHVRFNCDICLVNFQVLIL